jgi:ABC-type uncharacterized transport system auxiliary subunit
MKLVLSLACVLAVLAALNGCMASSTSPDGINCGESEMLPNWQRPLVCQGR